MIANPGHYVSLRAVTSLILVAYYLRLQAKLGRTVTPADVVMEVVREVRQMRDVELAYENPTDYPTIDAKDWPKTIEGLTEFLDGYLGETKIPLGYVIRKSVELPEGADPSDEYPTIAAEMIRRAPHGTAVYRADNRKVWDIIAAITRTEDCWTYVKPAQRTHNGRDAFYMLYDHYLGPNNVNNMALDAEHKLANTHYQGEKKRWTFEKYASQQVEQHSVLNGLKDHGHCGIDRGSEVRFLLNGIKTPVLDPVKTQILANPELGTDFHRRVNLFKDFIKQSAASQSALNVNISQMESEDGGGDRHRGEPEDRYYDKTEYAQLSGNERNFLRELRLKRGRGGGEQGNGGGNRNTKRRKHTTNADLNRSIQALVSHLSGKDDARDDDQDSPSRDDEAPATNRTNPALTRQQAAKKGSKK